MQPGTVQNYALLGEIDFRHPLLASFADPRFSDFSKIHFWKYLRLNPSDLPGSHVLAKFDSGDPALLEVPVGKGRVLILCSSWRPDQSQLALSTKFVPLLYAILEQSTGGLSAPTAYHVGDTVPLAAFGQPGAALSIRGPANLELKLGTTNANFSQTAQPGMYLVSSSQGTKRFAVNLEPTESRTAPLLLDELEKLGVPMTGVKPSPALETSRKALLQIAELESRQKLWRWLLISAVLVLLFETWLAGRAARQGVN
jgi:hypothetical protein